jgi:transposase
LNQKREKLIEEVGTNAASLSYIAKKLKIKQSTARMILRKYKESGEFRTKNFRNKRNTDLSLYGAMKPA